MPSVSSFSNFMFFLTISRSCSLIPEVSLRLHYPTVGAIGAARISSITKKRASLPSASLEEEIDPGEVAGLRVLKYPDPRLRAENAEITSFGDELKSIARRMFELMYAADGVGLAAPQVGINKRLMVYNEFGNPKKWLSEIVLVNPRIVEKSTTTDVETEGCLSFPGMNGPVKRAKWVKVEALNLKGKKIKKKFTDFEARIFQHEYDHLEGVVYIDHLDAPSLESVQPRLDELSEEMVEATRTRPPLPPLDP